MALDFKIPPLKIPTYKFVTFYEIAATIIIVFGIVLFVIFIMKLGPYGRHFLMDNLLRSGGATFLGLLKTGEVIMKHVKARGNTLRSGKKIFYFLPDLIPIGSRTSDIDSENEKEEKRIKELKYNELVKKKAYMNGRPLYIGTVATSVACSPHLADAISSAENKNYNVTAAVLKHINELYKIGAKEIHLVNPWDIDDLSEYLNITFTEQDIEETYQDGYIDGTKSITTKQTALLVLLGLAFVTIIAIVFFLG